MSEERISRDPDDGWVKPTFSINIGGSRDHEGEAARAAERAEKSKREQAEREKEQAEREKAARDEAEKAEAKKREAERIWARWRSAPDRITLDSQSCAIEEWQISYEIAVEEGDSREQKRLRQMVLKGGMTSLRGRQLDGADLVRMRNRLLGTYDHLPEAKVLEDRLDSQRMLEDRRWLIRDLWPWGTKPMLGGNKGAGKTAVATDLVPSLIIPGRKFLNHFEVPEVSSEDFGAGVWLINAETPAEDVDRALSRELDEGWLDNGVSFSECVHVEHLQEDFGGPHMFDLTNREIYQLWFDRLNECQVCDGDDNRPPFVLIVDGLTAILGGSTARYGEWYAKFRELMYALDIPNALVVVHNTMAGGHPMGGVEAAAGADGVWTYSSDNPDNPYSKRRFSVRPRLGGSAVPLSQVTQDDDGRLTLHPKGRRSSDSGKHPSEPGEAAGAESPASEPSVPSEPSEPSASIEELVLAYVRGCNVHSDGPTLTQVRGNVAARNVDVDATLAKLVKENKLEMRSRPQRGGGKAYWVING